ncbi:MAG: shikimate 5-dehydrogenase [Caulobacteraceae bacterium]|nr:shikimate 5-dehydrogenase [Caulobacteraceae bacterium]
MRRGVSGATLVAGVAGAPVRHSLSPLIHNAWLEAAGVDGVYVAFAPPPDRFAAFAEGLGGGVIRGLNVTAPFKETALALADQVSPIARAAGSANLLIFENDGAIHADSTDGRGLLIAFHEQAPGFDPASGPLVILGAGGAARAAAAAFLTAGAPRVDFVARTAARGEAVVAALGSKTRSFGEAEAEGPFRDARAVINATPLGLNGAPGPNAPLELLDPRCVVMDMVYRPIRTAFLEAARGRGLRTVDGLAMLIGQARPSFERFFGQPPPAIDVRALAVAALETDG